jgi:hypothetical protein
MIPREWIFSHRCSWMAVYVLYRNAQSKPHSDPRDVCTLSLLYQLPNCNLFIQHALFILWRNTTSELWTLVQFPLYSFTILLLLALFTLLALLLSFYHSIRLFLCLQQTGEIDNLIVSWEQSTYLCCAGFALLLVEDTPSTSLSGAIVRSVMKLASITYLSLAFSYWFD